MPQFDERDTEILHERFEAWNERKGPRVGDFVIMPDGDVLRFTHDWGDDIQTTWKGHGEGSFYLGKGYMSYSGALDPALPKACITDTGETRNGHAWFFHHDRSQAHNGVTFEVPCRVFRYEAKQKLEEEFA